MESKNLEQSAELCLGALSQAILEKRSWEGSMIRFAVRGKAI